MAISQRLEIRQSQALVMTPQLMQAIKLLQLSNLDLAAYVDGELERNPLLERDPEGGEPTAEAPERAASEAAGEGDGETPEGDWAESFSQTPGAAEEHLDTGLDNVFPDEAAPIPARAATGEPPAPSDWSSVGTGGREEGDYNLEAFVSAEVTLADHLAEQLALAVSEPALRMIGQHLIDMVDESGYLTGDLAAVADKLGTSLADVESVLAVVQGFEPAGVCARSLSECLAIQLKERNRFDPAMQALIAHLDLLAKRDFAALKRICGVDEEDLADMVAEIRRLNPKPGLAFGATVVQPIVPDVFVRPGPDGGWHVELNSETLPRVLVNQSYYASISKTAKSGPDKSYLADCMQTAR
jgi:RNA polymerase sigma-54 factor